MWDVSATEVKPRSAAHSSAVSIRLRPTPIPRCCLVHYKGLHDNLRRFVQCWPDVEMEQSDHGAILVCHK